MADLPEGEKYHQLMGLFARRQGVHKFCEKSTYRFPAFAQYLTDGFIRTRMPTREEDDAVRKQNTSNHQIDLCPLYGRTAVQTDCLRLKCEEPGRRGRLLSQQYRGEEYAPFLMHDADGEVKIKPEFEALDPPLGLNDSQEADLCLHLFAFGGDRANATPHVAMVNTLFLREHNRIAGQIGAAHPDWDDERVFQTPRNTVIVTFIKVVVEEYINHIAPVPLGFRADPSVAWDAPWNKPNWITTEFSLLYRWHSLIPDTITWGGVARPVEMTLFDNRLLTTAGLYKAFADLSEQKAGRLGAFNTAGPLVILEDKAIRQGRLCELASYSDYRAYVSLPRPRRFEDISSDADVVGVLKEAYRRVEDVEFYVGLFAEDPVKNSPLPPLILALVAVDAFSQALTNPLLSKSVFNPMTFSEAGWASIRCTHSLGDLVRRNAGGGGGERRTSMTQSDWFHRW